MDFTEFLSRCLVLDLETRGREKIFRIGALKQDLVFQRKGRFDLRDTLDELDRFADGLDFILGHNLLGHDLPVLRTLAPNLRLLQRPVVDTLYLSPIAFPENPYHRLVKDYRLVHDSVNDPVADARLAASLFHDQWDTFTGLLARHPEAVAFYRYCFEKTGGQGLRGDGLAAALNALGAGSISDDTALEAFIKGVGDRACRTAVLRKAPHWLEDPVRRPALAYCLAWLQVAGHNSVLPPWVRHRFPDVVSILHGLRDVPCDEPACSYCRITHDATEQLRRFFGFSGFRPDPRGPDGSGLQEVIVRHGMSDRPHLAILPTGTGKSLCYQLPALVRNFRRGVLTCVISPLQALMKDQVDSLVARTGTPFAAALYGMLTLPERGEVLERVRLGDVAILYVSPEQLRNRSFRDAISQREIGCWVFDEVHCLSKWGHDFRPDYLYAARFIREFSSRQHTPVPPVACFTATAKPDVLEEIIEHFRRELGQELVVFKAGVRRENLHFEVQMLTRPEKQSRIHRILSERLPGPDMGSAVVYTATRKQAEETAQFLQRHGWQAEAFHAGLKPPEKRRIQEAFINGESRIICATNAFGMGIDKEDVRLVIHANIPGSLENYLQEAGRAGRDRAEAECILLYDEQDIETQFRLSALSKLSQRDISQILRGLRRARRNEAGEVIITAGELLRDEEVETVIDSSDPRADTRVRTAVAWLERAGFLERNQNNTRVFQGRPLVRTMDEARARLKRLNLPEKTHRRWLAVLETLMNVDGNEGISADELAELPEFRGPQRTSSSRTAFVETDTHRVLRTLNEMTEAGLIKKALLLSAFVRHKVSNHSRLVFDKVCRLETAMLDVMQEAEPDPEGWQLLSLRRLNQRLIDLGHESSPEILRNLLRSLAMDGRGLAGRRGSLDLRYVSCDYYRCKLQRDWDALKKTAERRRAVAGVALETMLGKIPQDAPPSAGLLVEFSMEEIGRALGSHMFLSSEVKDPLAAIDRALMFLHEQDVIVLQQGLAVFRQAMTIRILPQAKRRRYSKGDYSPLEYHYRERIFQVHVMNEYARLGAERITQALGLVAAYFSLGRKAFVRRYFAGCREMIERATSRESYRRIVEDLANPVQIALVAAPEEQNMLVLAGPGSGKTRVVAHRCAYLLRVRRVPARSILMLCFNRNAATTLRRRLWDLVGPDAKGVTIQTYHGLAMRLTGTSFAERAERSEGGVIDFDRLIHDAIRLLNKGVELPGLEGDRLRERLLAGYSHILVDEYQDIDSDQYELVSAIAGRTRSDPDTKLTILAVGDDDQNIYTFRGANVEFIRRVREDYQARPYYMVENYRSSRHIIDAANDLIRHNLDRMKTGQPIRINKEREDAPPGGAWTRLDPLARGRVQVLEVADTAHQAEALVEEMQRLGRISPGLQWSDCAVLARTRDELSPIHALCEHRGIPVSRSPGPDKVLPLYRIREVVQFLDALKARRDELLSAADLVEILEALASDHGGSPWWDLVRGVIEEWREETGNEELAAGHAVDFFFETLAEQRREHVIGKGVFLNTVHAAKGMEFPHVFIPGGGWLRGRSLKEREEERRLYYVAVTRACETLCLFERRDVPNPYTGLLDGDYLLRRMPPVTRSVPREVLERRYSILGMKDLFLDFAGRRTPDDPVHRALASLHPGDLLCARVKAETVGLYDGKGRRVAVLSRSAQADWRDRLEAIESIRVLAMVQRRAADCAPDFRKRCRCGCWEVPLAEAVFHG